MSEIPPPTEIQANTSACYDTLQRHLSAGADLAQAAVPMGFFLSWSVNLRLFAEAQHLEHESLLLRIRFREAHGSELLVACGGDLSASMFTAEGVRFVENYYSRYLDDFERCFATDLYAVEESWDNYERIADVLTRAYMGAPPVATQGIAWLQSPTALLRKGWRKLWR